MAAATSSRGTANTAVAASRFAAACGALSQYVKATERARARPEAVPVRRPLPLMPGADVDAAAADHVEEPEAEPAHAQLTVLYGGRVLVFDDVPADKAADLLRLAAAAARGTTTEPVCDAHISAVDLPVARKASLQLFMEKRKSRLAARGEPYRRPGAGAGAGRNRDHLTLALNLRTRIPTSRSSTRPSSRGPQPIGADIPRVGLATMAYPAFVRVHGSTCALLS